MSGAKEQRLKRQLGIPDHEPSKASSKTILPLLLALLCGCSLRMPPYELAERFLSVAGVADVTEALYRSNPTGNFVILRSEGPPTGVVFNTKEEFDRYVAQLRLQEQTYREEIKRRGFQRLATRYLATASDGCSGITFTSGEVTVEQIDFTVKFFHANRTFRGVVVETTVTVFFPGIYSGYTGKYESPLRGEIGEAGIELRDRRSECVVILKPN